jgi:hypothetical protein
MHQLPCAQVARASGPRSSRRFPAQPLPEARNQPVRTLLPPLTIALAVVTASTLLLLAAAITPPPLSEAISSPPPVPASSAVPTEGSAVTTLAQSVATALPDSPAVIDLARLTFPPRTGGDSRAFPGPLLLVVASGILTIHADAPVQLLRAGPPARAAHDLLLRPGDGLLLPAATSAAVRNDQPVPAVVLAAGVFPAPATQSKLGQADAVSWAAVWSPGASVQPLAGGWLIGLAPGPATITLRRVSLPPGRSLLLPAPGPVNLAVETGALTLAVGGGLVWQQRPDGTDSSIAPASAATLLPGDAALLHDEASVTLRNDGSGPLLALVLSVTPVDGGREADDATIGR